MLWGEILKFKEIVQRSQRYDRQQHHIRGFGICAVYESFFERITQDVPSGSRSRANFTVRCCHRRLPCPSRNECGSPLRHGGKDNRFISSPEVFSPERWLRSNRENISPFITLPFGFGPRSCPGRRLAVQEVSIVIAKLLQRFNIVYNGDELPISMQILNTPAESLSFTFEKRNLPMMSLFLNSNFFLRSVRDISISCVKNNTDIFSYNRPIFLLHSALSFFLMRILVPFCNF
ncbi:probable cytochrome P450 301a1, mitochondrial [Pomacea canaliculata]|uniref:probable cytochrome P450 301a1, mitochondrial n=1 Tax=Pomacea canaliculata TaxID=400727 RepID=UPI000D731FFA|nr:probable cytochrome P450 301a1, mitochondrial [Pomacea canaliculata]